MIAKEKIASSLPVRELTDGLGAPRHRSFLAAQRILLDPAAQENTLLAGVVGENLGTRPGATLAGLADMGVRNSTSAGKSPLDLAAGEAARAVNGVKEGLRLPVAAGAVAAVARHRVDTLVGMQKHLLDAAAEQTHAWPSPIKKARA